MSSSKLVSIVIVVLVHALLGYALISGLAFEAAKKVAEELNVVDVKEEEPPEEPPPPPEEEPEPQTAPPVVSPPPIVPPIAPPPPMVTTPDIPKAAPPAPIVVPVGPVSPPPPPPPAFKPTQATPKGNPGSWATTNDYPSRALREEREGVTGFRVTVGPNGRVTDCTVTSSSGHPDLDAATCSNVTRRGRFDPAKDGSGNPTTGSWSSRVRWQIPK